MDRYQLPITRRFDKTRKRNIFFNTRTKKYVKQNSRMQKRLDSLRIPPAYRNVRISLNAKDKVQAIGIDSKNRKQYIYSELYKEEQSDVKFSDLIHFGKKLKRLRKNMMKLIMSCDSIDKLLSLDYQIAMILFIIDRCNFRVGCEKYKDLYNSYGVTTLNSDHLVLNANTVRIQFTGKKGVDNSALISNKYMVRLLKQLKTINENREYLFTYRSTHNNQLCRVTEKHINNYLKKYHKTISVKMFRTWTANYTLLRELLKIDIPQNDRQSKKNVNKAVKKAAASMHHTAGVSKKSYMNNEIIDLYQEDPQNFYKIIGGFRKPNGNMPSLDRTLNLLLMYLNSRS